MSYSLNPNGLLFPEEILSEIWLIVGLESLEGLHRCRQVCHAWNELIMTCIWGNPRKRKIIATMIKRNWGPELLSSSEEISDAKWIGTQDIVNLLFEYKCQAQVQVLSPKSMFQFKVQSLKS